MSKDEQKNEAVFRIHIRAPIHEVWAHLTRTDSVLPFFFNGTCRSPGLEPGAPVRMVSKVGSPLRSAAPFGRLFTHSPRLNSLSRFKYRKSLIRQLREPRPL